MPLTVSPQPFDIVPAKQNTPVRPNAAGTQGNHDLLITIAAMFGVAT